MSDAERTHRAPGAGPEGAGDHDNAGGGEHAGDLRVRVAMQRRAIQRKAKRDGGAKHDAAHSHEHGHYDHSADQDAAAHDHHAADGKHPKGDDGDEAAWLRYLGDVDRYLRNQAGAEKEALLDLRAHREANPVVGAVSEAAATVKGSVQEAGDMQKAVLSGKPFKPRHKDTNVKIPDEGIWDAVFAQLNVAHGLLSGEKPSIEAANGAYAAAFQLFRDAHRRMYEYRSRTEEGAQLAKDVLSGVEIGCDIVLTVLSAGMGAGSANVLKLGVGGLMRLATEQTMKAGLLRTALKAGATGAANKLLQDTAEAGAGYANNLEGDFDIGKIVKDAATHGAMTTVSMLIGGALSKVFMRTVGEIIGSRMAPESLLVLAEKYGVQGVIPPELFVSKGWRFLVGVAGDGITTALMTAVSLAIEQLKHGGKKPTAEQFVAIVVEQMVLNGFIQLLFGAVHHEHAKKAAAGGHPEGAHEAGERPHHRPRHQRSHEAKHGGHEQSQPHAAESAEPAASSDSGDKASTAATEAAKQVAPHSEPETHPATKPHELEPTGVQKDVAARVKELRARRDAEKDTEKRKALDAEIDTALASGRADMEAMVRKIHPSLQAVDAGNNLYKITLNGKEYCGTLEVLLDFQPPTKATEEAGEKLFSHGSESPDAKVDVTGGLAGTSSQGRVNAFPGDIDLAESIRVEAKSAAAAGEALAKTVQQTVATATQVKPGQTPITFERMSAGKYPPGHPAAGKTIMWTREMVEAGQFIWQDAEGKTHVFTLAEALGQPGDRVVNTLWKGPVDSNGTLGEITKVIRYEAFDAATGEKLFGTPQIGQAYQEVAFGKPQIHDTNRAYLTDALASQIGEYAHKGNWLKAVKRAHTVARMNGDMAALNDFAPLMMGDNAELKQAIDHLNVFIKDAVHPDGAAAGLPKETVVEQGQRLASRISGIDEGAGAAMKTALEKAPDPRANASLAAELEDKVLGALAEKAKGDADFAQKAERALRAHGYLKDDVGGGK